MELGEWNGAREVEWSEGSGMESEGALKSLLAKFDGFSWMPASPASLKMLRLINKLLDRWRYKTKL